MEQTVENILPYERDAFLSLNGLRADFWDYFMTIYSGKLIWLPLVLTILGVLIYKTKWKEALLVIAAFIILAVLCDQISASVIKPFFMRLRPSRHPDFENFVFVVDSYRGGKYGFISSHATNSFGLAIFSSLLFRYRLLTITVFAWALVNSYSRIYLGVHFISDIIGGFCIGILLGVMVYYLYLFARKKILHTEKSELRIPIYSHERANLIVGTVISSTLTIIIISFVAVSI
ncbi:MAG: phosphatase PAP2 family protein [Dysgonomonas sp.]